MNEFKPVNKAAETGFEMDEEEFASQPWESSQFKADADYWDDIVEPQADDIAPMPEDFIQSMNESSMMSKQSSAVGELRDGEAVETSNFRVKYKTEICKNWQPGRYTCKYGTRCSFAHGDQELKTRTDTHRFYKTKLCKRFHKDLYCPYGTRCQFIHDEEI